MSLCTLFYLRFDDGTRGRLKECSQRLGGIPCGTRKRYVHGGCSAFWAVFPCSVHPIDAQASDGTWPREAIEGVFNKNVAISYSNTKESTIRIFGHARHYIAELRDEQA
ncbi:hypothetical protein C8Q70DRAFT_1049984 [Cubamyces menziesii]|nr:hypothetical protein C8Q70DRAFT_1049984 [Cubamyces menziesii]